jgi:hypothetical protein
MLTGFELFACELLPGSNCELSSSPLDVPQSGDDNCLCCCYHVVPVFDAPPAAPASYVYMEPPPEPQPPFRAVPSFELPPRA